MQTSSMSLSGTQSSRPCHLWQSRPARVFCTRLPMPCRQQSVQVSAFPKYVTMENLDVELPADQTVLDSVPPPKNSMNVSAKTDAARLGLRICMQVMAAGEELPALLTIGRNSINQAVKGIAVTCAELSKGCGKQLYFQPAFRSTDRARPLMCLYLLTEPAADTAADTAPECSQVMVKGNCKIISVAGAIAGRIREEKRVAVMAIGVGAVGGAVMALGNARVFLEQDNLDIKVQPSFVKLEKEGKQMNAMRFMVTIAEEDHA